MTETREAIERALSLLGMARRARELLIGQDRVLEAMKNGGGLVAVVTEDCSPQVLRKICAGNCGALVIKGVSREEMGAALGVMNAQIAALPAESGFAKRLKDLLK
jgi:ribosomal protein L7Ae-like RNA K-turn-binding protein